MGGISVSFFSYCLDIARDRFFLKSTIFLDKGNAYSGNDDAVTLGVASVVNDLG
jgi:hypothetical protein